MILPLTILTRLNVARRKTQQRLPLGNENVKPLLTPKRPRIVQSDSRSAERATARQENHQKLLRSYSPQMASGESLRVARRQSLSSGRAKRTGVMMMMRTLRQVRPQQMRLPPTGTHQSRRLLRPRSSKSRTLSFTTLIDAIDDFL